MEQGIVIVTDVNGVQSIRSCNKENCDSLLLDACGELVGDTWCKYNDQEREDIAEDGLFSYGGCVAAIIWLDQNGNYNI